MALVTFIRTIVLACLVTLSGGQALCQGQVWVVQSPISQPYCPSVSCPTVPCQAACPTTCCPSTCNYPTTVNYPAVTTYRPAAYCGTTACSPVTVCYPPVSCCPTTTCYPPPAQPCCGETPNPSGPYNRSGAPTQAAYRPGTATMVPVRANYVSNTPVAPRPEGPVEARFNFFQQNGSIYAADRATGKLYAFNAATRDWSFAGAPNVAARR